MEWRAEDADGLYSGCTKRSAKMGAQVWSDAVSEDGARSAPDRIGTCAYKMWGGAWGNMAPFHQCSNCEGRLDRSNLVCGGGVRAGVRECSDSKRHK